MSSYSAIWRRGFHNPVIPYYPVMAREKTYGDRLPLRLSTGKLAEIDAALADEETRQTLARTAIDRELARRKGE